MTPTPAWTHLLQRALSLPGAWEDHPWGDTVVKVDKKIFVFLGAGEAGAARFSVKLPESRLRALDLPGAAPTGYGLGKAGWVTIPLDEAAEPAMYEELLLESYRAVVPKRILKLLGE